MKTRILIILLAFMAIVPGCKPELATAPLNIVNESDIFGTSAGVEAYMARIYIRMPIEDFRYQATSGFSAFFYGSAYANAGEAISRDIAFTDETFATGGNGLFGDGYSLIRECNYFMETIPQYASAFSATQVTNWTAEARFVRAMTYFALVKRYGGVPLVDKVLTKPGETIEDVVGELESFKLPRASEQAIYDFIASDLDNCFTNLPETNKKGRATKYAAAAAKSRAMLYAGCIAKYNTITLSASGAQVCGIPAAKANDYFKAAYDAATLLNGKFSLYKAQWSATDKAAQANNFAQLFLDAASPENIFIRQFKYPDLTHWYDANQIPRQMWNGGYSAETNPTLDLVDLFEGLPKNADGTFQTLDAAGHYLLYDKPGDPFANAEGRAKGTILFPGDLFKGQAIDLRRGIYTGASTGGINKLIANNTTAAYPTANLVQSSSTAQTPYTLPNGTKMNPAGDSGFFTAINSYAGGISGFTIRKYLDPNKAAADIATNKSDQAWIEFRYAEVLLNRAEAAMELFNAGQGATYQAQALADINAIQDRAGATLSTLATLDINAVRKERRKELAFENHAWFDLRRWRIADQLMNAKIWRILNGFYSSTANKYFYDDRLDERSSIYNFPTRYYYTQIPTAIITRDPNIVQNPGY